MQFVLMTADRKLYSAPLPMLDKLSITHFKGWHCTLGSNGAAVSARGDIELSDCGNVGTTCQQPMCFHAMALSTPKAQDRQTLDEFKQLIAGIDIRSLPVYSTDFGYPVALMSEFSMQQSMMIEWMLHVRCNYDCSYCPDRLHTNIDDYSDIETHKKTFLRLPLPKTGNVRICFLGGEPTLWKPLPEFLAWCHQQRPVQLRIMTNGSASVDRLISIHEHAQLIISLHDEYVTPKLLQRWVDFVSQTPHQERVVFKMFSQRPDYQEFIDTVTQHSFVRSSNYRLVNKETMTLWNSTD